LFAVLHVVDIDLMKYSGSHTHTKLFFNRTERYLLVLICVHHFATYKHNVTLYTL